MGRLAAGRADAFAGSLNSQISGFRENSANERAAHFEQPQGKASQIAPRRVTRSEIVDIHFNAQSGQASNCGRRLVLLHEDDFSDCLPSIHGKTEYRITGQTLNKTPILV